MASLLCYIFDDHSFKRFFVKWHLSCVIFLMIIVLKYFLLNGILVVLYFLMIIFLKDFAKWYLGRKILT